MYILWYLPYGPEERDYQDAVRDEGHGVVPGRREESVRRGHLARDGV